jgi:hypothetical protein
VAATLSSPGVAATRAVATVRVARTIDFDTGTAAEQPWLSDAGGSQSSGPRNRFADNNNSFVYGFPLPADTTAGTVTLSIDNVTVLWLIAQTCWLAVPTWTDIRLRR